MRYKSFCRSYLEKSMLDKEVENYLLKMQAWNNKIETRFCDGKILVTIISN